MARRVGRSSLAVERVLLLLRKTWLACRYRRFAGSWRMVGRDGAYSRLGRELTFYRDYHNDATQERKMKYVRRRNLRDKYTGPSSSYCTLADAEVCSVSFAPQVSRTLAGVLHAGSKWGLLSTCHRHTRQFASTFVAASQRPS